MDEKAKGVMVPLVARLQLHDGREFDVHDFTAPDVNPEPGESLYAGTLYYWTEGNNGCDCNRLLYIEREHNLDLLPEGVDDYRCGDTVRLLSLHVAGAELLKRPDPPVKETR